MPLGNTVSAKAIDAPYMFPITWLGVSDLNASAFIDKVLNNTQSDRFFLYASSAQILGGFTLAHVSIDPTQTTVRHLWNDYNEISAVFVEDVG